jgi:histidine triad (HIT) family protein
MAKEDKKHCIFCKIIAGKAPVSIVYEDEKIMVFPPLQPVNKGHLLIIPKKHAPYFADLDEDTAIHIIKMAKKLTAAIRKSKYKSEGVNLFLADGEAAHQEVFHFHLHVYPRFAGDDFGFKYDLKKHFVEMKRPELDKVAKEIKRCI